MNQIPLCLGGIREHHMNTNSNSDRRINDIRVNSIHVPVAVGVWRLPDLIGASVLAGTVGVVVTLGIYTAWLFVRNTGAFDSLERQRMEWQEECIGNTVLQFPDVSKRRIYDACKAKSQLYKADLRREMARVSN